MQFLFFSGFCLTQLQEVRVEGLYWEYLYFSGEQFGVLFQFSERGRGGSLVLRREDGDGIFLRRAVREVFEFTEFGCVEVFYGDEGFWACEQIMVVIMVLVYLGVIVRIIGSVFKMSVFCSRGSFGFWFQFGVSFIARFQTVSVFFGRLGFLVLVCFVSGVWGSRAWFVQRVFFYVAFIVFFFFRWV